MLFVTGTTKSAALLPSFCASITTSSAGRRHRHLHHQPTCRPRHQPPPPNKPSEQTTPPTARRGQARQRRASGKPSQRANNLEEFTLTTRTSPWHITSANHLANSPGQITLANHLSPGSMVSSVNSQAAPDSPTRCFTQPSSFTSSSYEASILPCSHSSM